MLVSAEGILIDPEIHDGSLDMIALSPTKTLTVGFSTASGDVVQLTLPGVERLKADNFLQGSVVFEVQILGGAACHPDLVRRAYGYDENESVRFLEGDLKRISTEGWNLIAIIPSYGCELVAIGRGAVSVRSVE